MTTMQSKPYSLRLATLVNATGELRWLKWDDYRTLESAKAAASRQLQRRCWFVRAKIEGPAGEVLLLP